MRRGRLPTVLMLATGLLGPSPAGAHCTQSPAVLSVHDVHYSAGTGSSSDSYVFQQAQGHDFLVQIVYAGVSSNATWSLREQGGLNRVWKSGVVTPTSLATTVMPGRSPYNTLAWSFGGGDGAWAVGVQPITCS